MSFNRRVCLLWLLAGLLPVAHAEDAKPAAAKPASAATTPLDADDEFLEFLGSIDTDEADEDWMDYLAQTDIAKVAKAKKKTPAATEVKK